MKSIQPYDLDLRSSGDGWMGTFAGVIRKVVNDITDDGPFGPVEVTLNDDGVVLTGIIDIWMGNDTFDAFTITESDTLPRVVEVEDVVRFRA